MTPNQLAAKQVGKDSADAHAKRFIRPFLRRHYAREAALSGSSWTLSKEQVAALDAAHKARQSGKAFDFETWRKSRRKRTKTTPKVEA